MPQKHQTYNGVVFTRDESTGYYLSTTPTKNGKRQRMHVYVWEQAHGPVPEGCEIHHVNGDRSDNRIENLQALVAYDHKRLHGLAHKDDLLEVHDLGIEAAKAWHGSEDGHKWHLLQYEKTKDRMHAPVLKKCEHCGSEFYDRSGHGRFCNNKCKAAHRRASGVDNIERVCVVCGSLFMSNKYNGSKACTHCRMVRFE